MGLRWKALLCLVLGLLACGSAARAQSERFGGGTPDQPYYYGGPGGTLFRRWCDKPNTYMVGVTLRTGTWVDAVRADCAAFDTRAGTLSLAAPSSQFAGGPGGGPQSVRCYPSEYVAGVKVGFTRDGNKPKFLDYVELICAPLDGGGENRRCLQTGNGCWDKHPDPGPYNGFGLAFESRCPSGLVVGGLNGKSGRFVDALGVSCAPKPMRPSPSTGPGIK